MDLKVSAELKNKTRRKTICGSLSSRSTSTVGCCIAREGVSGGGGALAVTIEKSEAWRMQRRQMSTSSEYVTTLFGSDISTTSQSAGADSANSNLLPNVAVAGISSCTLALAHTTSTRITTSTATSSVDPVQPFDLDIDVVFNSYGKGQQYFPGKASGLDGMRSRRVPALKGVSRKPSQKAEKPLAIDSKAEEKRAHIPKKRALSGTRKKVIEPKILPANSVLTTKRKVSSGGKNKETNQMECSSAFNQLQQINETLSPCVEIKADDDMTKTNKKLSQKRKKPSASNAARSRKVKKNNKGKNSRTKAEEVNTDEVTFDTNLFLRKKLDFLSEAQLKGLCGLKVLRPEMVLDLSLWQLNLIGINKGKELEAILSVLDNGQKVDYQSTQLHNVQSQKTATEMIPQDGSKEYNDDDEEQALVIDETGNAFQEIENTTCCPGLDLSLRRPSSDLDPITVSSTFSKEDISSVIDEIEKSLIQTRNSNASNLEKKFKIESILNQLKIVEDKYLTMKSNLDNKEKTNTIEQQPSQPSNEEGKKNKIFTYNLPTATSIFKLTPGQIVNDCKPTENEVKSLKNLDENPSNDAVKKMTLRSKSKSDESLSSKVTDIQLPKKEPKETNTKSSTICNSNLSYSGKSIRSKLLPNPATLFMINNKQTNLNVLVEKKLTTAILPKELQEDGGNLKTVPKVIKYVSQVKGNFQRKSDGNDKSIKIIDLANDVALIDKTDKSPPDDKETKKIVFINAQKRPKTDFPQNATIKKETSNIVSVNAKLLSKTDENETKNVLINPNNLTIDVAETASATIPKFVTSVTEENIANYASKLNFNLKDIRSNLVDNTFSNNKQFDMPSIKFYQLNNTTETDDPHSCALKTSNSCVDITKLLEEPLINPPEAFRFYSSQENSPQSSHKSDHNENSTTKSTSEQSNVSNKKIQKSLPSTSVDQDKDKNRAEYQHALNTFVHSSTIVKYMPRRDSDSTFSSCSSNKPDLSKAHSSTEIFSDYARVTSQEVIKPAPLKSIQKYDTVATTSANTLSTIEVADLRDSLNQSRCKKFNLLPLKIKEECATGPLHLTKIKVEKCNDDADSTTKSPEIIFNECDLKHEDNNFFNKLSTTLQTNINPCLVKIKQERSADADSTTLSPDLTENNHTTISIKKQRQSENKSVEMDINCEAQQIQPKEKKIKLNRMFNIKRKDGSVVPSNSAAKRSKHGPSTSHQKLHSPTPSSSSNKSIRQWYSKKNDKISTPDTRSAPYHMQQQSSSGYSSSASSSRVVYTHLRPTAAESLATRELSPAAYSTQSSSASAMQQNERNDSCHQIQNLQKKTDLRQELENRRARSSSNQKRTKPHRNSTYHQQKVLLSPKKKITLHVESMKKSDDERKEDFNQNFQSKALLRNDSLKEDFVTDNDDYDNNNLNNGSTIQSPVAEIENNNAMQQLISNKAVRKVSFDAKSDNCNNNIRECSDTGSDALSIASPTFSPVSCSEIASPASPKNSLSYYTSAPEINAQMVYPPMLYMLYEVIIPKEVNEPPTNLLNIKTEDPRLSKYFKENNNYSDSILSPARADPRLHRNVHHSDSALLHQQQQQQKQQQQQQQTHHHQQQQQPQQQPQPNMVLYSCLQRSPWYQGLMSTMKIQINQCISELVRALNNFQKERLVNHTAVFDIFKIDCACELMEIMRSLCISIDMNGVITDQKNFFLPNSIGGCSLALPSTTIKPTYSFVHPESPPSRVVAVTPVRPTPPQKPIHHHHQSSPFVSRYVATPPPLSMMSSPISSRPHFFDSRRQSGSKAPYMSRPPWSHERKRSYQRPPPQEYKQSYGRASTSQECERSYGTEPSSQMSASTTSSVVKAESEEECWD